MQRPGSSSVAAHRGGRQVRKNLRHADDRNGCWFR